MTEDDLKAIEQRAADARGDVEALLKKVRDLRSGAAVRDTVKRMEEIRAVAKILLDLAGSGGAMDGEWEPPTGGYVDFKDVGEDVLDDLADAINTPIGKDLPPSRIAARLKKWAR